MLGSGVAMLQTPVLDGLSFDPFPFQQDGVAAPEVDIGGREVIQALVVAPVVVVLDEDAELGFEITGQIIVLQQDPVLEGLVPALDLALGRRWCTNTVRRFEAADQTERMKSRVHPKYKTKYRVKNWASYDRALVRRGDITIWLSPAAIAAWEPDRAGTRGAQRKYSDLAIESALTRRLLFHLPLRQAEGFLRSLFVLMGLDLRVPDHTTLSRRGRHLDLSLRRGPSPHHRQQWSVDRRRG